MRLLKTLKGINDDIGDKVYRFNLRMEAIKWIDEIENFDDGEVLCLKHGLVDYCNKWLCGDDCIFLNGSDLDSSNERTGAIKILKHFFNITDAELMELKTEKVK